MKIKKIGALLLLLVVTGLQLSCSQFAVEIVKVVTERDVDRSLIAQKIKCV